MYDEFVLNAVSDGNTDFEYGSCENAQRLLIRFNYEIRSVIELHGLEKVGTALWYLYGCVSGTIHEVLDDSVASGYREFYESIESLYDNGFARYCRECRGHSDDGGRFATACYMIWDMDSGLDYLSFTGSAERLDLVSKLVDYGLRHRHAAVQESFLHCLGHRCDQLPDFVDHRLASFLRRRDLSPEIIDYARQCRTGMIL